MPVLRDIGFTIDIERVLQRQGYRDMSKVRPEMKETTSSLIEEVKTLGLIESAVAYETYQVMQVDPEKMVLQGGIALEGQLLPSRLPTAKKLIVVVSTIGPKLEARVKEYTASGATLKGMMLDGVGSAAMHSMTQEACARVFKSVAGDGISLGATYSPGMPGFSLSEQPRVLALAKADLIGVTLTGSGVMVPRKSTSRVIAVAA